MVYINAHADKPSKTCLIYNSFQMPLRLLRTLALAALCAILSSPCVAEAISKLRPSGYVNDFAGALDGNVRSKLESLCMEVDQKTHVQIAVVTIRSLDGEDVDVYAVDLFKAWGIADKANNRGV